MLKRRAFTAALAAAPALAQASMNDSAAAEWWVELTLPPLAQVPEQARGEQLQRIKKQQDDVALAVQAASGEVTARVTHVRNALAVRMTAQAAASLRAVDGVRQVRPVTHNNRLMEERRLRS
jgi:putative heme degradation protein